MEFNINQLLDKILNQLQKEVNTDTIIGKEFQLGEYKVVPVMQVGMGFGGGIGNGNPSRKNGSESSGAGGGAGGGFGIKPVGFLISRGDEIKMLPASGSKGLSLMFEKLPDIMEKAIELKFGKREEKGNEEATGED